MRRGGDFRPTVGNVRRLFAEKRAKKKPAERRRANDRQRPQPARGCRLPRAWDGQVVLGGRATGPDRFPLSALLRLPRSVAARRQRCAGPSLPAAQIRFLRPPEPRCVAPHQRRRRSRPSPVPAACCGPSSRYSGTVMWCRAPMSTSTRTCSAICAPRRWRDLERIADAGAAPRPSGKRRRANPGLPAVPSSFRSPGFHIGRSADSAPAEIMSGRPDAAAWAVVT